MKTEIDLILSHSHMSLGLFLIWSVLYTFEDKNTTLLQRWSSCSSCLYSHRAQYGISFLCTFGWIKDIRNTTLLDKWNGLKILFCLKLKLILSPSLHHKLGPLPRPSRLHPGSAPSSTWANAPLNEWVKHPSNNCSWKWREQQRNSGLPDGVPKERGGRALAVRCCWLPASAQEEI